MLLILLFFFYFNVINTLNVNPKYFSNKKWSIIRKLYTNNPNNLKIKNKIHEIIYKQHKYLINNEVLKYSKSNKEIFENYKTDFIDYAELGLKEAIKCYNVSKYPNSFTNLAVNIIKLHLNKCKTIKINETENIIPHNSQEITQYYYSYFNIYDFNGNKCSLIDIWELVLSQDIFTIRCFHLKYNYYLKQIRTDNDIAFLLNSSYIKVKLTNENTLNKIKKIFPIIEFNP